MQDAPSTANLDDLLEDVLSLELVEPELILRYEADPASLSAEERQRVEEWQAHPANRDALAAMQGLGGRTSAVPLAPRRQRPAVLARAPRRTRWLTLGVGSGVAAGAALVLVLSEGRLRLDAWSLDQVEGPSAELPISERPPSSPPAPAEAPQIARSAAPPREELDSGTSGSDATAELASAEADSALPPTSAAPKAPEPRPADGARPADAPTQVLVALLPLNYQAPSSSVFRELGTTVRSAREAFRVETVSPRAHVGLTATPFAELYWFIDRVPAAGTQIYLTVSDEAAGTDLLDQELPLPQSAGLQYTRLGLPLAPEVDYRWSISVSPDPEQPSLDSIASGGIRYSPPPAELESKLSGALLGRVPAIWASSGYFYEAFRALDRLTPDPACRCETSPKSIPRVADRRSVLDAQQDLLRQAGNSRLTIKDLDGH